MSKKKFIRLHAKDDNSPIIFNTEKILYSLVDDNGDIIVGIKLNDETNDYFINETPQKIYNQIAGYGFVTFHRKADNKICVLNINSILSAEISSDYKNATMITLEPDIQINVIERPELVYNAITKALTLYNSSDEQLVIKEKTTQQKQKK